MYAEYELCSNLPAQIKYEEVSDTIQVAFKARKLSEVSSLKELRSKMGYVPLGISAAEMRARLNALLVDLEARHTELLEDNDTNNSVLCLQLSEKVKRLLAP